MTDAASKMCTEPVESVVIEKNVLVETELSESGDHLFSFVAKSCSSGAAIIVSISINSNLCHMLFSSVLKVVSSLNWDATCNTAHTRDGCISFLPWQSPGRRKILTVD